MLKIIYRTIFFYFFVTFSYRIMGKREVGELGIIDLIVSIMIAEMVALSIEKTESSIFLTVIPIIVLVLIELLLGYISLKSRTINKLFAGKPTMIIKEGKILYKNMISQRYSLDDLLLELRKKSIISIDDVEYAFLEINGSLSIFPYKNLKKKGIYPMPIIIEGKIQYQNLSNIGKSKLWLKKVLEKNNIKEEDIFYAIYKNTHIYIIKKTI